MLQVPYMKGTRTAGCVRTFLSLTEKVVDLQKCGVVLQVFAVCETALYSETQPAWFAAVFVAAITAPAAVRPLLSSRLSIAFRVTKFTS